MVCITRESPDRTWLAVKLGCLPTFVRGAGRTQVNVPAEMEKHNMSCEKSVDSQHDRTIGNYVRGFAARGVMAREIGAHRLDAFDHAFLEPAVVKRTFHLAADSLPLRRADTRVDAAIREYLDVTVGEQQVDQHAVVVFGVPNSQLRENIDRALARRAPAQQRRDFQGGFDGKADLSAVRR